MSLILGKEYGGIYEGWELIADVIVTTNSTSVTISGINGDEDIEYLFIIQIYDPTTLDPVYRLYPNGITTNHSRQELKGSGTTVSAARYSVADIAFSEDGAAGNLLTIVRYYAKSGHQRRYTAHVSMENTVVLWVLSGLWNETTTVITSFTIEATQTNAIGSRSRILLFKKRG